MSSLRRPPALPLTAIRFAGLLKASVLAWIDDSGSSMGAALAYYTLFSIAPLILIVIAVAGIAFGEDTSRSAVVSQLGTLLGTEGAASINSLLQRIDRPATGIIASLVGIVTLFVGATSVVSELESSLDRIWRVPSDSGRSGFRLVIESRLLSFGLILALGFLLLVSLLISAAVAAIGTWWSSTFGGWGFVLQTANLVVGFVVSTVLFALIYKILPRARVAWSDVWIGAAVTSLLFSAGKLLIGLYVGYTAVASPFGAAGSIVLVMVWVYYSAQIFLLGAEFTWLYAHAHGSHVGQQVEPRLRSDDRSRQENSRRPG